MFVWTLRTQLFPRLWHREGDSNIFVWIIYTVYKVWIGIANLIKSFASNERTSTEIIFDTNSTYARIKNIRFRFFFVVFGEVISIICARDSLIQFKSYPRLCVFLRRDEPSEKMLNFNSIESSYAHPIALNGANNYVSSSITQATNTSSISPACQQQSIISNDGIHRSARHPQQITENWPHSESIQNGNAAVDQNCANRNDNRLPTSNSTQSQNNYIQTVISESNGVTDQDPNRINAAQQYLHQKGSENVKRFSVNNLLQLANNRRLAVGKFNE